MGICELGACLDVEPDTKKNEVFDIGLALGAPRAWGLRVVRSTDVEQSIILSPRHALSFASLSLSLVLSRAPPPTTRTGFGVL